MVALPQLAALQVLEQAVKENKPINFELGQQKDVCAVLSADEFDPARGDKLTVTLGETDQCMVNAIPLEKGKTALNVLRDDVESYVVVPMSIEDIHAQQIIQVDGEPLESNQVNQLSSITARDNAFLEAMDVTPTIAVNATTKEKAANRALLKGVVVVTRSIGLIAGFMGATALDAEAAEAHDMGYGLDEAGNLEHNADGSLAFQNMAGGAFAKLDPELEADPLKSMLPSDFGKGFSDDFTDQQIAEHFGEELIEDKIENYVVSDDVILIIDGEERNLTEEARQLGASMSATYDSKVKEYQNGSNEFTMWKARQRRSDATAEEGAMSKVRYQFSRDGLNLFLTILANTDNPTKTGEVVLTTDEVTNIYAGFIEQAGTIDLAHDGLRAHYETVTSSGSLQDAKRAALAAEAAHGWAPKAGYANNKTYNASGRPAVAPAAVTTGQPGGAQLSQNQTSGQTTDELLQLYQEKLTDFYQDQHLNDGAINTDKEAELRALRTQIRTTAVDDPNADVVKVKTTLDDKAGQLETELEAKYNTNLTQPTLTEPVVQAPPPPPPLPDISSEEISGRVNLGQSKYDDVVIFKITGTTVIKGARPDQEIYQVPDDWQLISEDAGKRNAGDPSLTFQDSRGNTHIVKFDDATTDRAPTTSQSKSTSKSLNSGALGKDGTRVVIDLAKGDDPLDVADKYAPRMVQKALDWLVGRKQKRSQSRTGSDGASLEDVKSAFIGGGISMSLEQNHDLNGPGANPMQQFLEDAGLPGHQGGVGEYALQESENGNRTEVTAEANTPPEVGTGNNLKVHGEFTGKRVEELQRGGGRGIAT